MDSIQSRPRKDQMFEYFFYIEFDSPLYTDNTQACLAEIKKICESFKVLGTYPMDI